MFRRCTAGFALAGATLCILMLSSSALADESAGATGTWSWTMQRRGGPGAGGAGSGETRTVTLKLVQDGDKLTGTLSGFRNMPDIEIQEGTVKDGQISFKVVRKRDDQEFTSTYTGTLDGDSITGKIETNSGGETRSRDWEAKRGQAPTTAPSN